MEKREINDIGFITGAWPLDPIKPTLVFIHGAGGAGDFWQAQVEGLSERANTVAVDLPGHGSSRAPGRQTIEAYARDVIEFMSPMDLPNPIACGVSMGGAITLQLLLDYPQQFRAGILLNTGARLKVAPVIFDTIENNFDEYLKMIGKLVASKGADPRHLERFREIAAACGPQVTRGDFKACNQFNAIQRLGSITLPVLIVSAEDDRLTPPKYAEFLEQNIAGATRVHFRNAGHILSVERPDALNRAVIRFLDDLGL